jgi:hypothetical protein
VFVQACWLRSLPAFKQNKQLTNAQVNERAESTRKYGKQKLSTKEKSDVVSNPKKKIETKLSSSGINAARMNNKMEDARIITLMFRGPVSGAIERFLLPLRVGVLICVLFFISSVGDRRFLSLCCLNPNYLLWILFCFVG